jgi:hypothetical protein
MSLATTHFKISSSEVYNKIETMDKKQLYNGSVTLANEEPYYPSSTEFVMLPDEPNYFVYVQVDQDGDNTKGKHLFYNKQTCRHFYIINAFYDTCPVLQRITRATVLLPDIHLVRNHMIHHYWKLPEQKEITLINSVTRQPLFNVPINKKGTVATICSVFYNEEFGNSLQESKEKSNMVQLFCNITKPLPQD